MVEIFSETGSEKNRPKNRTELAVRLKSIERCINNDENLRQVSIEFCKRAFKLLEDCGLITEDNVYFLSNAEICAEYDPKLKFPYNKTEGVLRKTEVDDNILDKNGIQRFYHGSKMQVLCGELKSCRDKKYLDKKISPVDVAGVFDCAVKLIFTEKIFKDCNVCTERSRR